MDSDAVNIAVFVALIVVFPIVAATIAFRRASARERARFDVQQGNTATALNASGPTTEAELGAVLRLYPTDNGRRARNALVALVIGAACLTLFGTLFFISGGPALVNVAAAGLAVGVPALCLWRGIVDGVRCYTRRGESFSVHEGGIVHRFANHTRVIGWSQFRSVVIDGKDNVASRGLGHDTWFSRALGRDVHCRVQLADGTRFRITGFTRWAQDLADALSAAVYDGTPPARSAGGEDARSAADGLPE